MGLREWQDKSNLSYLTHEDTEDTVSADSMNVDWDTHRGIFTLVWCISSKVLHSIVHFWQFQIFGTICVSDEQNTTLYYHWHYNTLHVIIPLLRHLPYIESA